MHKEISRKFALPLYSEKNKLWYIVICCVLIGILFIFVEKFTRRPMNEYLNTLDKEMRLLEEDIFKEVNKYQLYTSEEIESFNRQEEDIRILKEKASAIWDAIPVGAVIGKTRGSSYRSVGKAKESDTVRRDADDLEATLYHEKKALALKHGSKLKETASSEVWDRYLEVQTLIQATKDNNAWYYKSWSGVIVKIIHVLAIIILSVIFIVFPLSYLASLFDS